VHFAYDEDQEEFRRTVRSFFEKRLSLTELPQRVEADGGFDRAVWDAMAEQLGLQGLIVPERHGGAGYGPIELGLVLEEAGRALLPGPYFATIALGATALGLSGDEEAQAEHLPAIATGERTATLALAEPGDRPGAYALATSAAPGHGGHVLTGEKTCVYHGDEADTIVVAATDDEGPALFVMTSDAPGLERERCATLDPTRPQARLRLAQTPARRIGGEDLLDRVLLHAAVALAAEQTGGAQGCVELATAYAKERVQFGRPIGSFQAVKHFCADMLVHTEVARTATWYAAWACAEAPEEVAAAAPIAQHAASEAYAFASRHCIQVLGGIGFTWEHPAHLHYRRALSSAQFLGTPDVQLSRLADVVLDDAPVALATAAGR
jgi:alkylation response protein AidB-like acyl-CoA dehydrogenase